MAKVTDSPLQVSYEAEAVYETDSETGTESVAYYVLTRRATKRYRYVNLSEGEALATAETKRGKYTRQYSMLDPREPAEGDIPSVVTAAELTSEISAIWAGGEIYEASVAVSEADVKSSLTLPADIASAFSTENQRDYDD